MGGDDREVLAATMDLKAEPGTATGVGHTGQAEDIHGLFIWLQNNRLALAAEANFVACPAFDVFILVVHLMYVEPLVVVFITMFDDVIVPLRHSL